MASVILVIAQLLALCVYRILLQGMDLTTDELSFLVRKWQTPSEAHVDVKTTDNYALRMFCNGFTKRCPNQVRRTCYAQSSQIRQIRRKMREIMINQATTCDLKGLVQKFIPEMIGKEIEKDTANILPPQNVHIRKVKILKAPKFDSGKLLEVHGETTRRTSASRWTDLQKISRWKVKQKLLKHRRVVFHLNKNCF